MCLLTTLSVFYPSCMILFQLSMVIDISCHWIHLHTSLLEGKGSHKYVIVNTSLKGAFANFEKGVNDSSQK